MLLLLKRKKPLLKSLVTKLKMSSYVQVTIIRHGEKPVYMRCTVPQFAHESVALCAFHGSYVREFELSHIIIHSKYFLDSDWLKAHA